MSASVTWKGLREFQTWLESLPENVSTEAEHIVQGEANAAAFAIRYRYPARTGNLRSKVVVQRRVSRGGLVSYVVKNTGNVTIKAATSQGQPGDSLWIRWVAVAE